VLTSALSCEGIVALILDGKSAFEISIAGFIQTIGAYDLEILRFSPRKIAMSLASKIDGAVSNISTNRFNDLISVVPKEPLTIAFRAIAIDHYPGLALGFIVTIDPRSNSSPLWKRVLGGVIGLLILVILVFVARRSGVSGETAQRWETLFVLAGAGAGVIYFLRRRTRR
jgi:hypothetical protein